MRRAKTNSIIAVKLGKLSVSSSPVAATKETSANVFFATPPKWEDASETEIKKKTIEAYSRYAF